MNEERFWFPKRFLFAQVVELSVLIFHYS